MVKWQASLSTQPADNDWFDLDDTAVGDGSTALTETGFRNFSGNFVWLRVSVTSFQAGTINRILYN